MEGQRNICLRAYQNKKAELNGPELRVPPVGLGGPGGTSRYGHYWDIAAPRDVNQIKSPIISVEPTDYNGSKEFCTVSLNLLKYIPFELERMFVKNYFRRFSISWNRLSRNMAKLN